MFKSLLPFPSLISEIIKQKKIRPVEIEDASRHLDKNGSKKDWKRKRVGREKEKRNFLKILRPFFLIQEDEKSWSLSLSRVEVPVLDLGLCLFSSAMREDWEKRRERENLTIGSKYFSSYFLWEKDFPNREKD